MYKVAFDTCDLDVLDMIQKHVLKLIFKDLELVPVCGRSTMLVVRTRSNDLYRILVTLRNKMLKFKKEGGDLNKKTARQFKA